MGETTRNNFMDCEIQTSEVVVHKKSVVWRIKKLATFSQNIQDHLFREATCHVAFTGNGDTVEFHFYIQKKPGHAKNSGSYYAMPVMNYYLCARAHWTKPLKGIRADISISELTPNLMVQQIIKENIPLNFGGDHKKREDLVIIYQSPQNAPINAAPEAVEEHLYGIEVKLYTAGANDHLGAPSNLLKK